MVVFDWISPKLVFNDCEDVDREVSLDQLLSDKTIENLEELSTEDLLHLDANRPSSSGRKSVTFSDFLDVEIISPQIIRKLSANSNCSLTVKPILKKEDENKKTTRKMIDFARDRLYKDLRMLVEARDKTIHAIELESNTFRERSIKLGVKQSRFLEKLQANKDVLDSKIDQVWQKLTEVSLKENQADFVFSVHKSEELTIVAKKKATLHRRNTSYSVTEQKKQHNDNLELASDYATRLQQLRGNLIRRDSEIRRAEEKSVIDIVSRVSRALHNYNKN